MLKLYHGDCLEIMQDIPAKSIDVILCDLPYGATNAAWDEVIPLEKLWEQYNRIKKDTAPVVLFGTEPFTSKLISSNYKEFRYNWYWLKNYATGFTYAKYQPMRKIETISVFYKKGGQYYPQGLVKLEEAKYKPAYSQSTLYRPTLKNEHYTHYTNYPRNVLEFDSEVRSNKGRLHPTQKPVKLLEYLIKTYTSLNDGDPVVLDNCMGSGSAGVAAVNTGRRFIGIEKDNTYFEVAKQRINDAAFSMQ